MDELAASGNLDPDVPIQGGGDEGPLEDPGMAPSEKELEDGLRAIAKSWLSKLEAAQKHKKPFTADANEAMNFFDGANNWFWSEGASYSRMAPPSFRMVINKAFEAVKLFGSVIYHRNPVRTVTAKKFPVIPPESLGIYPEQQGQVDPMTGQPPPPDPRLEQFIQTSSSIGYMEQDRATVAELMESYLNYTPNELNLKEHSRKAVDEGIIKGMGVLWTELLELEKDEQGGTFGIVGSFFDSCDNLLLDPDANEQEDCLWSARRCIHPVKDVAEKYGLDPEELRGHIESNSSLVEKGEPGSRTKKRAGKTNDLISYWKIYSKTGFGHTLKGFPKEFKGLFDGLGPNCYVVVADGVDYPLNVPKSVALEPPDESGMPNSLFARTRWPIPFYTEAACGWPWTPIQFHRKPGYIYPISHLKPGMAELRFLNWAMSFLATRVMTSCKTMVAVAKATGDDIKDQILQHEESGFSLIELSETLGKSVDEIISVFQVPQVNQEIWQVIAAVGEQFDKATGLTELAYGMTRNQYRSAAEAQVKAEAISVRPDDMANVLEDAMSMISRKEALAARWLLSPEDVAPSVGPLGAELWASRIQQMDVFSVAREFDYRVEAGSARKPNKSAEVEKMQLAVQTLAPVLQGLIPMGMPGPMNSLLADWAKSLDLDASNYMIPPPPPPPPQPVAPDSTASPEEGEQTAGGGGQPTDESGNPVNVPNELMP
jgi:hypothetical protein